MVALMTSETTLFCYDALLLFREILDNHEGRKKRHVLTEFEVLFSAFDRVQDVLGELDFLVVDPAVGLDDADHQADDGLFLH